MAATKRRGDAPVHPGEILKDTVIPALGMSARAFALAIGVAPQTLQQVLEGRRPVGAAMALRLGKICGNGPDFWMNLQARWDLERARETLGAELDRIEERTAVEI